MAKETKNITSSIPTSTFATMTQKGAAIGASHSCGNPERGTELQRDKTGHAAPTIPTYPPEH
jgi:hypothetical protein